MSKERWSRGAGDFLAYTGPCLLTRVIVYPDAADDYADVYDGRDATSGRKLARFRRANKGTGVFNLGKGVPIDVGIYVDAYDDAVETTICFIPIGGETPEEAA